MRHLTKTDLVLFAISREQLSENTMEKTKHISTCNHCKNQVTETSQVLNKYRIQNEKQCNQYFELLLHNLQSEDPPQPTHELQAHFDECETCKQINQVTMITSPIDYAKNLKFQIPKHFLKKLDMKVYAELEKLDFSSYLAQKVENLLNSTENSFRVLKFFLFPTPSLTGIRGKDVPEFFIFSHKGGKIELQIGLANKEIKLFGIFKDKIFSHKSDVNGNVFFNDLPKDDYRVEIKGYAVSNIKTIS